MTLPVVSVRIPQHVLDRLDDNALHAGMTRSEYILSWLPEAYEPTPHPTTENGTKPPA